jgi:nucleotide-binding universal stress UspA family protein
VNILVPVDGSTTAKRAARFAMDMAKNDPSVEITILAVACLHTDDKFEASGMNEPSNVECSNLFATRLEEDKKMFDDAGVKVKADFMQGDAASSIVAYVDKFKIDQIIMGSKGMGGFKGLGSVTYKVLNGVKKPVTVIR